MAAFAGVLHRQFRSMPVGEVNNRGEGFMKQASICLIFCVIMQRFRIGLLVRRPTITKGDKQFSELSVSPAMKEFIYEVENSVYHCFGCRTDPTVWDKYWDFILSPNETKKNRMNSSAPHR